MSSDILLEEVNATVRDISNQFLSSKLSASSTVDDLNSLLVKEQVRLASLRRQQDLAAKLAKDLPDRITKIEVEAAELEKLNKALIAEENQRQIKLKQLVSRQEELGKLVEIVSDQINKSRESEALSFFQKNNLWFLISRVVELRKALVVGTEAGSSSSIKEEADFEYLSSRIEQNDRLIRQIEDGLLN